MTTHFVSAMSGLVIALAVAGCAATTSGHDRSVRIQRTTHGVAHITASDFGGIGFGVAYGHAQDNVCQTAAQLVTVRGERSKFFGPTAMGQLGLRTFPNEQIDVFIRMHMDDAALARAWSGASADAREAAHGYVEGYNHYLAQTGVERLPEPCRGAAWVRPMTQADYHRLNEVNMVQIGIGLVADAVLAAKPPSPAVASATQPPTMEEAMAALRSYRNAGGPEGGEPGSNGWAFGRDATPDGRGLLLGNPHFPWTGVNRFWQMHLTIPGKLDVMGASIGHNPIVMIGFNRDVAWTHTVSTGQRFTLHELTLDPRNPTAYMLDGQSRAMTAKTVQYEVTGADGKSATRQQTLWSTVWGPVVVMPRAGLDWTTRFAYALKDVNALNARSVDSWMAMNRARNTRELRTALGNNGIPWANTVAADRDGNAMYADLSAVPDVSAEQLLRCAPSGPGAALSSSVGAGIGIGMAIMDGSKSSCDWYRDPAAPVPGLLPPARMPVVVRGDWVQNSNDSYWLSNPREKTPDLTPMLGRKDMPQRLRTRIAIEEISARLAGKDGLAGNRMGMREAQEVLFRNRNMAGHLVVGDLLSACPATASEDVKEGCAALEGWDRTNNLDSRGAALFREFWRKAKDIPGVWRVPFDPARPVATPAGLRMSDESVRGKVFEALAQAVSIMKKSGFAPDAPLGAVQGARTAGGRVPLHGGDEFEGVLNKVETKAAEGITAKGFEVDYGPSYLLAVTFDEAGPVAQALLVYGQSSDPASPWSLDQLPLYSRKRWEKLPFHPADMQGQEVGPPLVLVR